MLYVDDALIYIEADTKELHTYIHNWPLQPFRTTNFLRNFFMAGHLLSEFLPEVC